MKKVKDKTPEILDAFWAVVDKFEEKWKVKLIINLEGVEEFLLVHKPKRK